MGRRWNSPREARVYFEIRGTETGCTHGDVTSKRWVNKAGSGGDGASAERFAFPVFAIISLAHHRGKLGLDCGMWRDCGMASLGKGDVRASRDVQGGSPGYIYLTGINHSAWTVGGSPG